MTPLDAALRYAAAGWHVFPCYSVQRTEDALVCACGDRECISPAKHPIIRNGHLQATTDPQTITAWWASWPEANVAISMRASGLVAIDVDPRNGGRATQQQLEDEHGFLPRAVLQSTGGDGDHILLADPGGDLRGKLGAGVDVRSRGYILAEPSNHISGGRYTWRALTLPAPPVPASWLALLRKPLPDEDGPAPTIEAWRAACDTQAFDPADAAEMRKRLDGLERGHGRGATFQAVRTIFHGYGLSLEEGWPYLCEWNAQCGKPYSAADLERQLHRIAGRAVMPEDGQRGHARRHGLDLATRMNRARALGGGAAAGEPPSARLHEAAYTLPPPPEPGTFAWHVAEAKRELERILQASIADAAAPLFGSAHDLLGRPWPQTPWLVQGLITDDNGITVIATEPKSAKTWLATEIAVAVATGTPVAGEFPTTRKRVAYYYAEDRGRAIATRLRSLCAGAGRDVQSLADLFVQPAGASLDVTSIDDCARIVASCRMLGDIGMLWLDPLRDVHSGDEDSSNDMARVGKHLRAIASVVGCTVGFVHHSAKASADTRGRRLAQRMRGSSAIHGFVDCGIYLADLETDDRGTFTNRMESQLKSAQGAGHLSITLKIEDDASGQAIKAVWSISREAKTPAEAKGSRADEAVLARVKLGPPMPKSLLRGSCGISVGPASEAIQRLLGTGALVEVEEIVAGPDMRSTKRRVIVLGGNSSSAPGVMQPT